MKDSKSILLLIVSVLLILVSCALLWTWGYNFNNFAKDKGNITVLVKDSTLATTATRDSLKKIYEATLSNLGILDSTWSHADSLKNDLDVKLSEFYKLRNDIAIILKNPEKKEDLDLARQKIGELQKKVNQLRDTNTDVETENQRLHEVLKELAGRAKENAGPSPAARQAGQRTDQPAENILPPSVFTVSDIRLTGVMADGGIDREAANVLQVDKLVGSFNVKNNLSQFSNTEIIVVVLQPDNKVLQASSWESGRFETKDGTRVYSCKVKFEYAKGEDKHLTFTISADKFQKGTYSLLLYSNGNLIGKTTKTLI